jgi:NAD(P)-dependent dehydrogenase (short-subunit alcohol dehydrogenase family)
MEWTLVTGAAKGLGAAICLELAAKRIPVIIHYDRSENEALSIAQQCRNLKGQAEIIHGNFATPHNVELFLQEYLSRFPTTRNLINNVGNYLICSPSKTAVADWRDLYQVNLFTPLQLIEVLLPSIQTFQGSIVNIGAAFIQNVMADTHATAYTATKLSLWMATKSLAKELVAAGVRVNMVSPGHMENSVDLPEEFADLLWQRPGKLSEVARAVSFLLDPNNSYITGQNIEVGGGLGL